MTWPLVLHILGGASGALCDGITSRSPWSAMSMPSLLGSLLNHQKVHHLRHPRYKGRLCTKCDQGSLGKKKKFQKVVIPSQVSVRI